MPRKVRKTGKLNSSIIIENNDADDDNNNANNRRHDMNNGSAVVSREIGKKKRPARENDSSIGAEEADRDEIGPPKKKRNNEEDRKMEKGKKTGLRAAKRPLGEEERDCGAGRAKTARMEREAREWVQTIGGSEGGEQGIGRFVVARIDASGFGGTIGGVEKELEAVKADVVCLRTVRRDVWAGAGGGLECALRLAGFHGDFFAGEGDGEIGVATVYRAERFQRIDIDCGKLRELCLEQIPVSGGSGLDEASLESLKRYLDEPGAYIVSVLSDRQSRDGQLLIIGNAHLSNPHGGGKQDVRCVQAVGMLWRIWRMLSQIKSDVINNNNSSSNTTTTSSSHQSQSSATGTAPPPPPPCWILCGDFNSLPDNSDASGTQSPVFQICRDGYPDEASIRQLQALRSVPGVCSSGALVDVLWHSFQHPLADLSSPYSTLMSHEPSTDAILLSRGGLHTTRVLVPAPAPSLSNNHQPPHHNSNSSHQCLPVPDPSPSSSSSSQSLISLACEVSFKSAPSQ